MICSKCGRENIENSKFCIGCGNSLIQNDFNNLNTQNDVNNVQVQNMQPNVNVQNDFNNNFVQNVPNMQTNMYNQTTPINNQPMQFNEINNQTQMNNDYNQNNQMSQNISNNSSQYSNINTSSGTSSKNMSITGYLFFLIAVILKPFTAFKEEKEKFDNFKNSAVLSLILSGVATIINLIKTMLSAVIVKSYSWSSGNTTKWVWSNLKEVKYVEVIGKNFLIYLGIIAAIAVVYYLASLIIKKQTNFSRLLGISAAAITPMLICSLILSPLLAKIYAPIGMFISIIGLVYTIIIIYETINEELSISGNVKFYVNLVCLSILGISAYYLYFNVLMSSVSNSINDIFNMFK